MSKWTPKTWIQGTFKVENSEVIQNRWTLITSTTMNHASDQGKTE